MTNRCKTRIVLLFLIIFFSLQLLSTSSMPVESWSGNDHSSKAQINSLLILNHNILIPTKADHRPLHNTIPIKFISVLPILPIIINLINIIIYFREVLFDNRKSIKKLITQHIEGNKYKYSYFSI
jgi:hypothetical protein